MGDASRWRLCGPTMPAFSAHVNPLVLLWRGAAGCFIDRAIENAGGRDYNHGVLSASTRTF